MTSHIYRMTRHALGASEEITISEEQFEEIKNDRKLIIFALSVEEKLDLLAENYADLEREMLDMALHHSIFSGAVDELLSESRHRVNRRLINFLTSVRLYHDQTAYALSNVYGKNSDQLARFRELTSGEYDSHLSYRVIEALRNHVQHVSLPVTSIAFPVSLVNLDNIEKKYSKVSSKVIPYIELEYLEKDGDFKKAVLGDMRKIANQNGEVELIPIVRSYVSSIGRIHNSLREIYEDKLKLAEESLAQYREMVKDESDSLAALKVTDGGVCVEHVYLSNRVVQRWGKYKKKNRFLDRASLFFVSSQY